MLQISALHLKFNCLRYAVLFALFNAVSRANVGSVNVTRKRDSSFAFDKSQQTNVRIDRGSVISI